MQGIAFGPTIRLLRQAKGISLRAMAKKLGVSPAFLSQIEAGRQHKIPKARIVQVAQMLGVSEAYLLGTARRIHPDVVEFLREMPEAAEFMITAMQHGLEADDFADLREALRSKMGKAGSRRAKLTTKGKKKTIPVESIQDTLERFLDPALCITGLGVMNKDRLFQRFTKLMAKKNKSVTVDQLMSSLEKRERQATTNVGGGVAIPHAYIPGLPQPILGVVQLKRAISYNSTNDEKVKSVFFLFGNEERPEYHLSTLARIARLCSDPEFLQTFTKARTSRELYKIVLRWDKRIGRT
jgi:PTS system nitrogen regulatory IIA component